ncbi:MAG: hypothetical protein KDE45_02010 [Caldilineaceae bacterium]|nr:hypothetical protein [Caldilineaceae bacterium]
MQKELGQWDALERQLKRNGVRSILGALLLVAACIALAAIIAGCQPGEKPSTADLLIEAENVVTAGIETVGQAVQIGTLDPASREYRDIYNALRDAGVLLDAAWTAYRGGDMGAADESRRAALALYQAVRPALMRYAQ